MELTPSRLEAVLSRVASLRVAVVGDLFLDRYLEIDDTLTEASLETGLDAYQVVGVRSAPGAAGTIINNLVALGTGQVIPVAVIGLDGEGYELEQALRAMPAVALDGLVHTPERRTPTYTKPMLYRPGQPARELNRLDIHPRSPLPPAAEEQVLTRLHEFLGGVDAVAILDQVAAPESGVITERVRASLGRFSVPALADSRYRIGAFRGVMLKPNEAECRAACPEADTLSAAAGALAKRADAAVFCTRGERGILLALPSGETREVPGRPVQGAIDPVGAGDSTTAGILCALAAGLTLAEAATFGCLVASITVQKLGTTGTASPQELRDALSSAAKGQS